jgi:hypothetical protein
MLVINGDKIRYVLDTLTLRGLPCTRACMDQVEGLDRWRQQVQAAVQAAERGALE